MEKEFFTMPIRDSITALVTEMAGYRRTLHAHPQLAFQETFASDFVAARLTEWGIPFHRGLAKTGIVARIEGVKNTSNRAIAIRGDMDEGQKYGVNSTPTFFVNGYRLRGAVPIEQFSELIDDQLSR
mgnify:CR=1 FL=1